jgi:hypothetical protein
LLTPHHGTVLGERWVGGSTLLEGVVVPFRGVRCGGRTGAGGTVSKNDTSDPAQHPNNAADALREKRVISNGHRSLLVTGKTPVTFIALQISHHQ